MTAIGGLAQYLNSATSYQSNLSTLSSTLLGGTSNSGSSTSSGSSASSLLFADSAQTTYDFPTDASGRPVVATMSDMNAVARPKDKLTIAGQVAEAIRMQSDCCVKGGSANRITDLTTQTQTLLDAVNSVVSGVATNTGSASGSQSDPGVTPYASTLSTVLGRVASVMANLQVLTSCATPQVASQTKSTLASLGSEAGTIAAQAGLSWSSLTKTAMTTLTSGGTTASTPRLIDYLL